RSSDLGGIYDLFMGGNQKIDHGLVRHNDGKIDTGYRYILTLNIVTRTNGLDQIDFDQLILPEGPKTTALLIINENGGKEVRTGCRSEEHTSELQSREKIV